MPFETLFVFSLTSLFSKLPTVVHLESVFANVKFIFVPSSSSLSSLTFLLSDNARRSLYKSVLRCITWCFMHILGIVH